MERYFGVHGKARVQRILDAIEASGGTALEQSDPSVAPFEFRVRCQSGETLQLICYAFTANEYRQKGRPPGEHRFQIKYGGEFNRAHSIYVDASRRKTTLMFGIHSDMDVFIAVDPTAHNPTWFSSSVEFKKDELLFAQKGWHQWERDRIASGRRRAGPASVDADFSFTTEILTAFRPRHFLDFARFERIASGLDAGERALLSEKVARTLDRPRALDELLCWPLAKERVVAADHPLLRQFGLTHDELLSALQSRFRLLAAVRGSVAEVHLGRLLQATPGVSDVQHLDEDGQPDFVIRYRRELYRIECKNVLRTKGERTARVDFRRHEPQSRIPAADTTTLGNSRSLPRACTQ